MRCPLRVKALDKPDTCDTECAWLVKDRFGEIVCAVTAIPRDAFPMNIIKDKEMKNGR